MKQTQTKMPNAGEALFYHLYLKTQLDRVLGGEYISFSIKIKEYFNLFLSSNFRLLIVMDGVLPSYKEETRLSRFRKKIDDFRGLLNTLNMTRQMIEQQSFEFVPIPDYCGYCFIETVQELRIPLLRTIRENDRHIATLAKWLGAFAVLSSDSDFYILDCPGFIHFDSIHVKDNGHLYGKLFEMDEIVNELKVPKYALPLLAVSLNFC